MRRLIPWLVVVMLFAAALAPVAAQTQTDGALRTAVAYMRTQQQADGSFTGLGAGSTADAVYALVAAHEDPAAIKQGGKTALDFINGQTQAAQKPGSAAKFALALAQAGQQPKLSDGTNLLDVIDQSYNGNTGRYGEDVTTHAYAVLALLAAEHNVPAKAVDALRSLQRPDGGWSFDGTGDSDTNTTSVAVQALVAAGEHGDAVNRAVAYYHAQQNDDAGFPSSKTGQGGTDSDANSTALSIQALLAAGQKLDDWSKNTTTPLQRLIKFQNGSGAFRYNDATPADNAFATYQAVPALAGKPLPIKNGNGAPAPAATETAQASTTAAAPAAPSTAASTAPSVTATTQPLASSATTTATQASAAASAASTGGTQQLPATGAMDLLPMYAVAASVLMLGGVALRRRRA